MGDDDARPPFHQLHHRALNQKFRTRIDAGCRLIKNQNRRIGENGPRDGQQLPLALAQITAVLAQNRVVAIRHSADKQIRAAQLGGGLYVFIRSQIDKDWGAFGTFAMFAVVFVLMGMQFVSMGLMGEYIGKIHLNSRARPQFFIESVHRKNNTQPKEQE